ncbi:Vegetative incompatibility protein HET-E-1, partial [Trametes pubescens]
MRLLNTGTLRIVHFPNPDTRPPYAILSHVWQGDEASYQDIHALRAHPDPLSAGPEKVRRFCAFARAEGFEWAWLDACCIDKTSSSELSEALNSMFRWYRDAVVCYAFLHDVPDRSNATSPTVDDDDLEQNFVESVYFTRGWTLQELLAPRLLFFVSSEWTVIGTKHSWASAIQRVTGIDLEVLTLHRPLHKVSLARQMSWAARRRTTRPEDRAYSLMGIFGVNMATLYGEGAEKAFYRLQEEILRHCPPDQSLFAWGALNLYDVLSVQTFRPRQSDTFEQESTQDASDTGRLLAPSPDCFMYAGDIVPVSQARISKFLGTQLPTPRSKRASPVLASASRFLSSL